MWRSARDGGVEPELAAWPWVMTIMPWPAGGEMLEVLVVIVNVNPVPVGLVEDKEVYRSFTWRQASSAGFRPERSRPKSRQSLIITDFVVLDRSVCAELGL